MTTFSALRIAGLAIVSTLGTAGLFLFAAQITYLAH